MNDVLNGQIVPALGQGQAIVLIVVSLAVASLLRRLWSLARGR